MKKYLLVIAVAAILLGNLALCEANRQEVLAESQEINDEYVYFYELVLSNEELSDKRRVAYQTSYRTFISSISRENYRNDPELYAGLIEE